MNRDTYLTNTFLAFLGGAALGALIVALTTPKKGAELRDDLSDLGRRMKDKAGELAQRGAQAFENTADQAGEIRKQASEAWQDTKKAANKAGSDMKHGMAEVAHDLRG